MHNLVFHFGVVDLGVWENTYESHWVVVECAVCMYVWMDVTSRYAFHSHTHTHTHGNTHTKLATIFNWPMQFSSCLLCSSNTCTRP